MNAELEKIPGVIWNFSQPISDNVEEAVSGVKGQLATKATVTISASWKQKPIRSSKSCSASPELKTLACFGYSVNQTSI
jgi:cobalt-zinc-cadmium resistance protein CzcA